MFAYDVNKRGSTRGFTLIELLIAVVIVGILSMIAIPSYQEHVRKSRRAEGTGALLEGAQQLERYYSTHGTYLDGANLAAVFPVVAPATGAGYYDIAAQAATATTFTLRATRKGSMSTDRCGNFEITQSGARQLNGATATVADCWRR